MDNIIQNPGMYIKHSKSQLEYIAFHAGKLGDYQIGKKIGLSKTQVAYYRRFVLQVKASNIRREIDISFNTHEVKNELEALLKFHATYTGCMMETLERRIKELSLKARL